MLSDSLKLIWDCAELERPVLTIADLRESPAALESSGLLKALPFSESAACEACGEGHYEKVIKERYPDGEVKFFIFCQYGGGRVEIDSEKLKLWGIAYKRFAEVIALQLKCAGSILEIIPDRLWNLGKSMIPLEGMRRPIWLARKLRGCNSSEIINQLPTGRSALLFSIGQLPNGAIEGFERERIFNLPDFLSWEKASFTLKIDMIKEELGAAKEIIPLRKKPAAKRAKRASTADKLNMEITQHLKSAQNYAFKSYDRTGQAELLPPPTMQQLAERLGVNKSTISRTLKDKSCLYTKILWDTCNDIEKIMKFKAKR